MKELPIGTEIKLPFATLKVEEAGLISPADELGNRFRIIHFDNDFRMILNTWDYLPIKYVHELQNLFFIIARKDLNIQI